jgi:VanZ family protein
VPERADPARLPIVPPALWRGAFWISVVAGVVLSLWPMPEKTEHWFPFADKFEHAIAFAVLVAFGTRAGYRIWPMLVLGLLALGAAIEVAQGFTPMRTAGLDDWLADAVGIAGGWLVVQALERRSRRQP